MFFSVEYEWTSVRDNARADTQLAVPNICFELELRQYHSRGSAVVPNLIVGCDAVAVTSDERYCFLYNSSTNSTWAKLTARRKKSDSDLLVYLIIYFTPQTQTVCNWTDCLNLAGWWKHSVRHVFSIRPPLWSSSEEWRSPQTFSFLFSFFFLFGLSASVWSWGQFNFFAAVVRLLASRHQCD